MTLKLKVTGGCERRSKNRPHRDAVAALRWSIVNSAHDARNGQFVSPTFPPALLPTLMMTLSIKISAVNWTGLTLYVANMRY